MIKQTDLQARLRLLRYGLLVVVIMTFVVTMSYPITVLPDGRNRIGDFIVPALLYSAVVGILSVAIYLGYRYVLLRTLGHADTSQQPEKK